MNNEVNKFKVYFKTKIMFIYGIILIIIQLPALEASRGCDRLEEKLNLDDAQKRKFNLKHHIQQLHCY